MRRIHATFICVVLLQCLLLSLSQLAGRINPPADGEPIILPKRQPSRTFSQQRAQRNDLQNTEKQGRPNEAPKSIPQDVPRQVRGKEIPKSIRTRPPPPPLETHSIPPKVQQRRQQRQQNPQPPSSLSGHPNLPVAALGVEEVISSENFVLPDKVQPKRSPKLRDPPPPSKPANKPPAKPKSPPKDDRRTRDFHRLPDPSTVNFPYSQLANFTKVIVPSIYDEFDVHGVPAWYTNQTIMNRFGYTIFRYQRMNASEPNYVRNRGTEGAVFLRYIVDHYDNFPDIAIFVHANPSVHAKYWLEMIGCIRPNATYFNFNEEAFLRRDTTIW